MLSMPMKESAKVKAHLFCYNARCNKISIDRLLFSSVPWRACCVGYCCFSPIKHIVCLAPSCNSFFFIYYLRETYSFKRGSLLFLSFFCFFCFFYHFPIDTHTYLCNSHYWCIFDTYTQNRQQINWNEHTSTAVILNSNMFIMRTWMNATNFCFIFFLRSNKSFMAF